MDAGSDSPTLAAIAGEAYDWFETRKRDDDSQFVTLKDGHPDWLHELVMNAHGDFLPDDWRYESIRSAIGHVHDNDLGPDDLDDAGFEWADDNVDVYNGARFAWLASNLNRQGYCDEALDEFGPETISADNGVSHLIGMGQYLESREVWALVTCGLVDRLEELTAE